MPPVRSTRRNHSCEELVSLKDKPRKGRESQLLSLPELPPLFNQYNHLLFDDELPKVRVEYGNNNMKVSAGLSAYHYKYGYRIALSPVYFERLSTKDLHETLIHEMVHLYLDLYGHDDDSLNHGPLFQDKVTELNKKLGTLSDQGTVMCMSIKIYNESLSSVEKCFRTNWWKCNSCTHIVGYVTPHVPDGKTYGRHPVDGDEENPLCLALSFKKIQND